MKFQFKVPIVIIMMLIISLSCNDQPTTLPYLGPKSIGVDGQEVYHKVRDWTFLNQDSTLISNKTLAGKPYVADFFFTSCPSICPKVTREMLRIHNRYKDTDLQLVSFTIDPKRDDVKKLALYAANLEVSSSNWHFLTGDKDFTLDLADDYFVTAYEDESVPGGFDHSGKILLVDGEGHIRAFAEGTDTEDVTELFDDIDRHLKEYAAEK